VHALNINMLLEDTGAADKAADYLLTNWAAWIREFWNNSITGPKELETSHINTPGPGKELQNQVRNS